MRTAIPWPPPIQADPIARFRFLRLKENDFIQVTGVKIEYSKKITLIHVQGGLWCENLTQPADDQEQ